MKVFSFPVLLFVFVVAGCAHGPEAAPPQARQAVVVSAPAPVPPPPPAMPVKSATTGAVDEYGDIDLVEKAGEGEARPEIADPLEPFNRAMYHFNDKLYFWVLKPVAQGYGKAVPEPARIGVRNFFANLAFPIRFVNCLLQANFDGAAAELGRFTVNTLWGVGGFLDPAASTEIDLAKRDEDFGQTLGAYGVGQGFFINWPVFGPSSPRDTLGLVGDGFLTPSNYLTPWYAATGAWGYEKVNDTSLRIGDYESLKGAAIDPYVAIRDAYVQYRLKQVGRKGGSVPREETGSPKN